MWKLDCLLFQRESKAISLRIKTVFRTFEETQLCPLHQRVNAFRPERKFSNWTITEDGKMTVKCDPISMPMQACVDIGSLQANSSEFNTQCVTVMPPSRKFGFSIDYPLNHKWNDTPIPSHLPTGSTIWDDTQDPEILADVEQIFFFYHGTDTEATEKEFAKNKKVTGDLSNRQTIRTFFGAIDYAGIGIGSANSTPANAPYLHSEIAIEVDREKTKEFLKNTYTKEW